MTVAARAIQDGDQSVRSSHVRLNRAARISRGVCSVGTNELSGAIGGKENDDCLVQSSAHGSSAKAPEIRLTRPLVRVRCITQAQRENRFVDESARFIA